MLKKVIIILFSVILLAIIGIGVYIYTLDWNAHKNIVEKQFTRITGLNTKIKSDLKVELIPSPKFSANQVTFSKQGSPSELMSIATISANVDLLSLLDKKFILSGLNLNTVRVNVQISESGDLNWSGIVQGGRNSSGNVAVSFDNIQLSNSVLVYDNQKEQDHFEIPNISAIINASSLKGPFRTNGKFIYNNNEIKFGGDIVRGDTVAIKMTFDNEASASKLFIDGNVGSPSGGTITFDTNNLTKIVNAIFGEDAISPNYALPLYLSFQYNHEKPITKFENFNVAFGQTTKGNGTILLQNADEKHNIEANFDMPIFDLSLLEYIGADIVSYFKKGHKAEDLNLQKYLLSFNLKSDKTSYKDIEAQNLDFSFELKDNNLFINRLNTEFPADSLVNIKGSVNFNEGFNYLFKHHVQSNDLRVLASTLGADITKLAHNDNKKNIFKKGLIDFSISGNLDNLKISIPQATIDTTDLKGNIGFIYSEDRTFVLADIDASKIMFDKYIEVLPDNLKDASFEDKLLHQLNLIPWSHDIDIDASVHIGSAVYNDVPIENLFVEFHGVDEQLQIKKLQVDNIASGSLDLAFNAKNIYTSPSIDELSYSIRTNNFPLFSSTLGIDLGKKVLFNEKFFAAQGALSGTLNNFSISSVQKFGNTEFSYTGTIDNAKTNMVLSGDLELKTSNFSDFIKSLDFDYQPDIPVTSFVLSGKVSGTKDVFSISDLTSYLGANKISGQLKLDSTEKNLAILVATLDFDKFDADHWLNLNNKSIYHNDENDTLVAFIKKPNLVSEQIDYSSWKNLSFDIQATAKQSVFNKTSYADVSLRATLKDNILNVSEFKAQSAVGDISLDFVLNNQSLPEIEGNFQLTNYTLPLIGGNVYTIEGGLLDASGHFKSLATSPLAFFENITSSGKFKLIDTAIKGWDLDVIKFELEQRNTTAGLQDSILNNLKSGKSAFSQISGKYDIVSGVIAANDIYLISPIAKIQMKLDFNLSDWLFSAVFNTTYQNASFSDLVIFTFKDNLAQPIVTADLTESFERIGAIENLVKNALIQKEQKEKKKLSQKINNLNNTVETLLQGIAKMTLDVVRFKPITDSNTSFVKVYENNINLIDDFEKKLKNMSQNLKNNPSEKSLMEIETDVGIIKSKLQYIPKTLEDNFIAESKYIFDSVFNKLVWVYNVAQNNFSYYDSLTEAYETQISFLDTTDAPISEDIKEELLLSKKAISEDMDKVKSIHNKIREDYLSVVDTTDIAIMKENNDLITQSLETILTSTNNMDQKIIESIDQFRAALGISTRDYDEYMIYPPKNVNDINIELPTSRVNTVSSGNKISSNDSYKNDGDATDNELQKSLSALDFSKTLTQVNTLYDTIQMKKQNQIETIISSSMESAGLANLVKPHVVASNNTEISVPDQTVSNQPSKLFNDRDLIVYPKLTVVMNPISTVDSDNSLQSETIQQDNIIALTENDTLDEITLTESSIFDEVDNTSRNIEEEISHHTKTALNDILEQVKQTENDFKNLLDENKKLAEISNNYNDESEFSSHSEDNAFKVNPVIGMDMNDHTVLTEAEDIAAILNQKTGFKKSEQPIKPDYGDSKEISATDILKDILMTANQGNFINIQSRTDTSDAASYIESQVNSNDRNVRQYLQVANGDSVPFSGTIVKSMLNNSDKVSVVPQPRNQYIFAKNTYTPSLLVGSVHKNTSLY